MATRHSILVNLKSDARAAFPHHSNTATRFRPFVPHRKVPPRSLPGSSDSVEFYVHFQSLGVFRRGCFSHSYWLLAEGVALFDLQIIIVRYGLGGFALRTGRVVFFVRAIDPSDVDYIWEGFPKSAPPSLFSACRPQKRVVLTLFLPKLHVARKILLLLSIYIVKKEESAFRLSPCPAHTAHTAHTPEASGTRDGGGRLWINLQEESTVRVSSAAHVRVWACCQKRSHGVGGRE